MWQGLDASGLLALAVIVKYEPRRLRLLIRGGCHQTVAPFLCASCVHESRSPAETHQDALARLEEAVPSNQLDGSDTQIIHGLGLTGSGAAPCAGGGNPGKAAALYRSSCGGRQRACPLGWDKAGGRHRPGACFGRIFFLTFQGLPLY